MISVYKKFVLLIAITFASVVAFYCNLSKADKIGSNDTLFYFKKSLLSYPKECKKRDCHETFHYIFDDYFSVALNTSKEKYTFLIKLGLFSQYDEIELNAVNAYKAPILHEITKLIFKLNKDNFNIPGLEAFALDIINKSNAVLNKNSVPSLVEGVFIIDFLVNGKSVLKKPNNDELIQNYVKKKTEKNKISDIEKKKHYSFKHKKRDINNIIFMCAKEVREKYVNPRKFEPVRFSIVPATFDYYPNMSQITLQGEYNLQKTYASCWVKNKPIKIDDSRIHKINEFSLKTTKFIRIPEEVWKKINKLY